MLHGCRAVQEMQQAGDRLAHRVHQQPNSQVTGGTFEHLLHTQVRRLPCRSCVAGAAWHAAPGWLQLLCASLSGSLASLELLASPIAAGWPYPAAD